MCLLDQFTKPMDLSFQYGAIEISAEFDLWRFVFLPPSLPVAELDHDLLEDLKTKSPSVHQLWSKGRPKGMSTHSESKPLTHRKAQDNYSVGLKK